MMPICTTFDERAATVAIYVMNHECLMNIGLDMTKRRLFGIL